MSANDPKPDIVGELDAKVSGPGEGRYLKCVRGYFAGSGVYKPFERSP